MQEVTDPNVLARLNAASQQGRVIKAPDPYQRQKARNEAAASETAPGKAATDARISLLEERIKTADANTAAATSAAERDKAIADAAKAQAELEKIRLEMQGGNDPKSKALNALQSQVDRVSELYRQRLHGGLPNAVNAVIPNAMQPGIGAFDSAAQGLTNPFMAAFRIPGVGSQSDTELRQFMEANTPSPNDSDAVVEEKLGNIQRRIDAERGTLDQPKAQISQQQDRVDLATGKTRDVVDPVLKATAGRVGRMVADGVSDDKIKAFLKRSGVDPSDTNIDAALGFRRSPEFKQWQRQNPGKAYPVGPNFYTKQVPMSASRSLLNSAVQTPLGAGAVAAGNAVTGGFVDELTDDPEMARTGMQLIRSKHPAASLAGDVAGFATMEGALAKAAPRLAATKWGRRGLDTIYGAFSGAGEAEGDRLTGALTGGIANTAGGMAGRGLQGAAGGALTGVKNANLGYLNNAGIPLTVGQIGRGSGTTVGNAIGGLEDRAAGIPIFDAIVNSARHRGEQGFNRAAFREAGGSGVTGARGVGELQGKVNSAYNFLDGADIPLDARFAGSQAGVRAGLPDLPAYGPQIGKVLDTLDRSADGGVLSGRDWQSGLRSIKGSRSSLRGKEFSDEAVNALGDVEGNLLDLAARQGPPGTKENLTAANMLNKQFKTITGALDNGPTQARGELFSPTRLDTAARQGAVKFGGRSASMQGQRPFYDLTKAGMDVMPNQVPDSGTAGRALMYSTLFGAGLGSGLGYAGGQDGQSALQGAGTGAAAVPFALAALYSKPGQKIIQKALLGQRGEALEKIGEFLKHNPRLAGILGASLARDFTYQPELPQ